MDTSSFGLRKYLRRLKDPRINRCKRHLLGDIIAMAICAVIGNADTWKDIATFARRRKDWFQRFLELPNGIPSHHTFRRVFDRLEPLALQHNLVAWLHSLSETLGIRHIAIDGKTLRHSGGGSSALRQLHLVSAWATQANLTLGQVAVDSKSNEITAIPLLLELLDLRGALVTIDAMGCQKDVAKEIVARGGDYVLAVKGNQEHLLEDVEATLEKALNEDLPEEVVQQYTVAEKGHGREEKRSYIVVHSVEGIGDRQLWPKLTTVGLCCSERILKGQATTETRYFIGSRKMSARQYAQVFRDHWRIENGLHWQMDVTFDEDASRIQNRQGGQNFSLLRRMALGLLKQHPSKDSIRTKRYEAALDTSFLEEVLTN